MSIDSHNHAAQDGSIRQVMGRVEEAVYALDTNWDFSYLNDCAAELLDADPETLLGESIWEVLPGATETDAFEAFHEAMETGEPTRIDMYYETTDRWFTVRAHPGPDGLTVCFEDVTGEQRQALEVQRKQRLFEAVFEDTRDALVVADTDRQVTEFNPAAEQLFGYDAEAMIGRSTAVLYADAEESDTQGEQRFNERTEERHEQYVVEYERADGTTFEGETVGTSLEGPDGETLASETLAR